MRVMVLVKATKESEAGVMPSTELLTEMGKFNEELVKAGVMLEGAGLQSSAKGARIRFTGGCVANATASRVSLKTERKLRIFEDDAYLSLDLQQKILTVIRKRPPEDTGGLLPVTIEEQSLEPGDALKAEIDSFLDCIRTGRPPVVPGEAGLTALETAMRITEQVNRALAERAAHHH